MAASKKEFERALAERRRWARWDSAAARNTFDARLSRAKHELRQSDTVTRREAMMSIPAGVAGAMVASQVHRELAVKRSRPGAAGVINLASGVLGAMLIGASKPDQSGVRSAGRALTAMAISQLALSLGGGPG